MKRRTVTAVALTSLAVVSAAVSVPDRSPSSAPRPAFADALDAGTALTQAAGADVIEFGPTTGSQVAITLADAWHTAGFDGTGVKIGVIDYFDVTRYWNTAEHGPTPISGVTARCLENGADCTADFYDGFDDDDDDHGVAVVEVIKDMAPDAEIYIARALTSSDYRSIVDWFASAGVAIINRSLGSRYDGPGDGRGSLNAVASYATSKGLLWVNSGGNNGRDRYYRHPARLVADGAGSFVAFGPSGADRFLKFNGCISLGGVRWINDWDKPAAQRTDYDLILWDSPLGDPAAGSIVDSSSERQRVGAAPIENFGDSRCPSAPLTERSLYLEIRWRGGDTTGDVIEILDYGQGMSSYTQAAQSAATAIADSADPGVLAVGAIDPASRGVIASYSSQGPTNDGRIAPDIAAPAGFISSVRAGGFAGSSAASAVVAGGAALLLDAGLATDPGLLGNLIRHIGIDRGATGPDNVYGHGEFRLPAPPVAIDATPSVFTALSAPQRALDTRPETATGPAELTGRVEAGEILDLPILGRLGVPPAGVTAVAVNVTGVDLDRPGWVQALPTLRASLGGYSNLNVDAPGQTRANFAIVPIGADGEISLISTPAGHLVVDVLGYFAPSPAAVTSGRFVELPAAARVLDTRVDGERSPLSGRTPRPIPIPPGIDPASISALVMTVTGTGATQPGWLQVHPTARTEVIGRTSTVNLVPGVSVANTAIVAVDGGGASVTGFFGSGSGHVVIDVVGYITSGTAAPSEAGRFVAVRPARALDTRTGIGVLSSSQQLTIDAGSAPGVTVPSSATAVVWNLTMVDARRPGWARIWATAATQPTTSALNWSTTGEIRAAAAISAVDSGRISVFLSDGTPIPGTPIGYLVADVFGYFT